MADRLMVTEGSLTVSLELQREQKVAEPLFWLWSILFLIIVTENQLILSQLFPNCNK
jgi:hypothetical protein